MAAGEVIKYYRQKAGLTQEELGRGICSVTHVSKIERGQTAYSSELLSFFSEKLQVDIENEVNRLDNLENQLHQWHKLIIMQRMKEVEEINEELESIKVIGSYAFAPLYHLLQARYYLLKRDFNKVEMILEQIQRNHTDLPPYEKNLLRHVQGIYHLINQRNAQSESYQQAIQILKEINREEYDNLEYYYHLAAAYQWMDSSVMAYSYAEKALRYFKETDNFIGAIMAESLMLLCIGRDTEVEFQAIETAYQRLIHNSELLNFKEKKTMLLNNLGYEYYRRRYYEKAKTSFCESLLLVSKPSVLYLQRWHNYLKCCYEGKLMRKAELVKKAHEGLRMARELDITVYKIAFKLLVYKIEGNHEHYYGLIEKEALPFFDSSESKILKNRYGKELYLYYANNGQYEKAIHISNLLMDSIKTEM